MTISEFVASIRDNSTGYNDIMTPETAAIDLKNFTAEGWDIPEGMTPQDYTDAWNELLEVQTDDGTWIRFKAAVALMDDEIRETVHAEQIEDAQEFFDRYCELHLEKYGEDFEVT